MQEKKWYSFLCLWDVIQRNNKYMQALAPVMLLDIFNKRTSKNVGWSEIKLDNKSKINIKMRNRMEVHVGFRKWNPKKT
jgi:hypothetical protein